MKIVDCNLKELRVYNYLWLLNKEFIPHLDQQVDINEYAKKLSKFARFIVCIDNGIDVGLIGYYLNGDSAFISTFSRNPNYKDLNIAYDMFVYFMSIIKDVKKISLKVDENNYKAYKFYCRLGFEKHSHQGTCLELTKYL